MTDKEAKDLDGAVLELIRDNSLARLLLWKLFLAMGCLIVGGAWALWQWQQNNWADFEARMNALDVKMESRLNVLGASFVPREVYERDARVVDSSLERIEEGFGAYRAEMLRFMERLQDQLSRIVEGRPQLQRNDDPPPRPAPTRPIVDTLRAP